MVRELSWTCRCGHEESDDTCSFCGTTYRELWPPEDPEFYEEDCLDGTYRPEGFWCKLVLNIGSVLTFLWKLITWPRRFYREILLGVVVTIIVGLLLRWLGFQL